MDEEVKMKNDNEAKTDAFASLSVRVLAKDDPAFSNMSENNDTISQSNVFGSNSWNLDIITAACFYLANLLQMFAE